jgi:hypothetical protein
MFLHLTEDRIDGAELLAVLSHDGVAVTTL